MRSFSDLVFYSIPTLPTGSWSICALLALHMVHPGAEQIEVDGFIPLKYHTGETSPFTTSKIALFKKLIGLQRKGMAYGGMDLGQVLDACPLSSDFA
ncbi:hypothetical protein B0F90DRAFT_1764560 [Multifurca ochricompacta]|uniref:Uncharacterized protein n=1 Tax=Multifurca ochricompacta TaxID=376703 RepID=A0AAD4LXD1_9AGAM|nr:hypothetical protein B0F90DRAFT_1764560 [Multifurca ochricompacta]